MKKQSNIGDAEVDYLMVCRGDIVPVEVKAGKSGRLKSLHILLKTFPSIKKGMVFSEAPYNELPEQKLVFMPLYYAFAVGSG